MTSAQLLCIGFDGHLVTIHVDAPKVLAAVKRSFRHMLVPLGGVAEPRLRVEYGDSRYRLWRDHDVLLESACWGQTTIALVRALIGEFVETHDLDVLWLHASAAVHHGGAVLMIGPSGSGKSTIGTSLCAHGWSHLADDLAPVDWRVCRALPFPQAPSFRLCHGKRVPDDRVDDLPKRWVDLDPDGVARRPAPIAAMIFPRYRPDEPTELVTCSASAAAIELVSHCLSLSRHGGLLRPLCDLAQRVPAFRLQYASGESAAQAIVRVVAAARREPARQPGMAQREDTVSCEAGK